MRTILCLLFAGLILGLNPASGRAQQADVPAVLVAGAATDTAFASRGLLRENEANDPLKNAKDIKYFHYSVMMDDQELGAASTRQGTNEKGEVIQVEKTEIIISRTGAGTGDTFIITEEVVRTFDGDMNLLRTMSKSDQNGIKETRMMVRNGDAVLLASASDTEFRSKTYSIAGDQLSFDEVEMKKAMTAWQGTPIKVTYRRINQEDESIESTTLTLNEKKPREVLGRTVDAYSYTMVSGRGSTAEVWMLDDGSLVEGTFDGRMSVSRLAESRLGKVGGTTLDITISTGFHFKNFWELDRLTTRFSIAGHTDKAPAIFTTNAYYDVERDGHDYILTFKERRIPTGLVTPKLPITPDDPAVAKYLKATPLCQSDHELVIAKAAEITAGVTDSRLAAKRIVDWVYTNTGKEPGRKAEASALEVLKNRHGDCTEHAALTVALCRSVGIPARQVSGAEYLAFDGTGLFGFHAWAEVWLGEWYPVDATIPETGTSARYLFTGYNEPEETSKDNLVSIIGRTKVRVLSYVAGGGSVVHLDESEREVHGPKND